jgi:pyruvate/2-oxoacid:ferredoxin oxidoreductase alpha subunit
MPRQLIKGNDALVKGAVLAGCRAFYGYPITPANEISEAAAFYLPQAGGTFLQAESEVSAINMVYGAASAGQRAMTASSGPGISLMAEGISYLAGAELPCVVVNVMRGGPGLGNIGPDQADYFQAVKGGGHGAYRALVVAPSTAQEMCDLTRWAFDLADRYRTPVFVLADSYTGQMMEPVDFLSVDPVEPKLPEWAVAGTAASRHNLLTSLYIHTDELEAHVRKLEARYKLAEEHETRWENYRTSDAELVFVGYGVVARILKSVVEMLRARGVRAGLLRPITLYPFPTAELRRLRKSAERFFVVELGTGQMIEDVRLAVEGARPIGFYSRCGGNCPSAEEIFEVVSASLEVPAHA